jgi:two-component system phosphate regulon response regulator OmpR
LTNISSESFHILVVDDDERIRSLLRKFLIQNGYWTSTAVDASHAKELLINLKFDLIVLDVMMPGDDGVKFTADLRKDDNTPVLLLTAKGDSPDRIKGFQAGADDYLAKPFEPQELLLRISSILKRIVRQREQVEAPLYLYLGEITYDTSRGELWRGDVMIRLTTTEIALMRIFSKHVREPITRTKLVEDLGRGKGQAQERAVDVQVTRLRRKIETNSKQPRYIQTVRGSGYMLAPD